MKLGFFEEYLNLKGNDFIKTIKEKYEQKEIEKEIKSLSGKALDKIMLCTGVKRAETWLTDWKKEVLILTFEKEKPICGCKIKSTGKPCINSNNLHPKNGRCFRHGGVDGVGGKENNTNSLKHGVYAEKTQSRLLAKLEEDNRELFEQYMELLAMDNLSKAKKINTLMETLAVRELIRHQTDGEEFNYELIREMRGLEKLNVDIHTAENGTKINLKGSINVDQNLMHIQELQKEALKEMDDNEDLQDLYGELGED